MSKGVTPLAATIILVALSVGLGAVVMSWGEEYIEAKAEFVQGVQEVVTGCDTVSFTPIVISGRTQICTKDNTLEFLIDNGPSIDIIDFHVRLAGNQDVFVRESVLKKAIAKGSSQKLNILYPPLGEIRQVKITPKIKVGSQIMACQEKQQTFENVQAC